MENISVSVRVRPLNEQEAEKGSGWRIDNNKIVPLVPGSTTQFANDSAYTLDYVFGSEWNTKAVYDRTTEDVIKKVVGGFNGTVFAYGQTSSGKTHTMRGTGSEPGIIPLAVAEIFRQIYSMQDREFLLRVSYMELYNEEVNDLLAMENTKLQIHESKESGVYVAGLREEIVTGAEHVLELLATGEAARHIGETKMNKASSRSHTVFRMVVESRSRDPESTEGGAVWVSTLTLVDLAGSERIAKTGAEGLRMKEGASINKSLLTLGTVINKLSEGVQAQGGHIPYRDSKLTRILQPSLGGNAKTAIICNITPALVHQEESHSTLRFACRAKRVVNNAMVNEVLSDAAVLKRQAKEIEELRRVLAANGNTEVEDQIAHLRAELLHKEQENERVQLQLLKEREDRERAQRQVDGLTRLMLGAASEDAAPAKGRKENRRETWAPGIGKGNRKRPLASQLEHVMEGGTEGRKSEGLVPLSRTEPPTSSPLHQRRRSSQDGRPDAQSEAAEELNQEAMVPEDSTDLAFLRSRVKELETENCLIQRELDHVSDSAQRSDSQLRAAEDELMEIAADRDRMVPQLQELAWQNRNLERQVKELQECSEAIQQEKESLSAQIAEVEGKAEERVSAAERAAELVTAKQAELQSDLSAFSKKLKEAEQAAIRAAEGAAAEKEKLDSKIQNQRQELASLNERIRQKVSDEESSKRLMEDLEEKLEKGAERERDLYDSNKRLEAHIADLESRKRAPLYQKKQEEELRAATEKAQDADIRAQEAELKFKEAKAERQEAEKKLQELSAQIEQLRKESVAAAADASAALAALAQSAGQELANLKETHAEELASLQNSISALREQSRIAAEAHSKVLIEHKEAEEILKAQIAELRANISSLEATLGETQACADAAAEHIRSLEDQAITQRTEQEAELRAASDALEAAKAVAAQQLQDTQAQHQALADVLSAELQSAQEAVQAANERQEAERNSAREALREAAEKANAEQEEMQKTLAATQAVNAELEAKVARAASTLKAADELKEAKKQHREEIVRLQQQLKSTSASSKGGAVEADRTKKDLERTREKLQAAEAKLRGLVQDKNTALMEKANLERELKQLRSTTGRLTKDLDKKESAADKKLESMNSQLAQTKAQLSAVEMSLTRVQADLDSTQASLQSAEGERDSLAAELEDSQKAGADLMQEREMLNGRIQAQEAELEKIVQEHKDLQAELEARIKELEALSETKTGLESELSSLKQCIDRLNSAKDQLESEVEALKLKLTQTQTARDEAQAKLPEIEALRQQIKVAANEQTVLQRRLKEAETSAMDAQKQLDAAKDTLQAQAKKEASEAADRESRMSEEKATLEFQVQEAEIKLADATSSLESATARFVKLEEEAQSSLSYQQELESQLNEVELENQTLKATLEDFQTRQQGLLARCEQSDKDAFQQQSIAAEQQGKLANLTEQLQTAQAELSESLTQLTAQKQGVATLMGQCDSLRSQLQDLQAVHLTKMKEMEQAEQEKAVSDADWEVRLQEAVDSAEQWKEFAEKLGKEKSELDTQLTALQREMQGLQRELAEVIQTEASTRASLEKSNDKLIALRSGAAAEQSRLESLLAQARKKLEDQGAEAASEKSCLQEVSAQERAQLETRLTEAQAELHDARSKLAHAKDCHAEAVSRLQTQLQALQEEYKTAQDTAIEAQHKLQVAEREAKASKLASEELTDRLHASQAALEASQHKVRSLESSLEEAARARAAADLEASNALEAAASDLANARQEAEVLSAKAGSSKDQALSELKACHEQALAKEQARAAAVQAEMQNQFEAVCTQLEAARSLLEDAKAANAKTSSAKQAADAAASQAQISAEAANAELDRAQEEQMTLKAELRKLQGALHIQTSKAESAAALEAEVSTLRFEHLQASQRYERQSAEVSHLSGEVARLKTQLDHTASVSGDSQATPAQLAAERKVAELHSKLHSYESKVRQLTEDYRRLKQQSSQAGMQAVGEACLRCPELESQLRKSKRAQEKMTALQFRLKNDVAKAGGNTEKLEQHKTLLEMEYEIDFLKNRHKKEIQVLQGDLARLKGMQISMQRPGHTENKENSFSN